MSWFSRRPPCSEPPGPKPAIPPLRLIKVHLKKGEPAFVTGHRWSWYPPPHDHLRIYEVFDMDPDEEGWRAREEEVAVFAPDVVLYVEFKTS